MYAGTSTLNAILGASILSLDYKIIVADCVTKTAKIRP